MANNINFYSASTALPDIKDGSIYFVLDKDNKKATIKADLDGDRYTATPEMELATSEEKGLMSSADKQKIDQLSGININDTLDDIEITTLKDFNFNKSIKIDGSNVLTQNTLLGNIIVTNEQQSRIVSYTNPENPKETIWDFYLAKKDFKGERGDDGDSGEDGYSIAVESEGNTATIIEDESIEETSVIASFIPTRTVGKTQYYKWNFEFINIKGKDGMNGIPGPKGDDGKDFNFTISATEGSSVTVIRQDNANPDGSPNFAFSLPRGAKGDKGKDFEIYATYSSKEAMEAASTSIPLDTFVRAKRDEEAEDYDIYYKDKNGVIALINLGSVSFIIADKSGHSDGNVVTDIEYDDTNRRFEISKDGTFATETFAADVDNINSGTLDVAYGGTGVNTTTANAVLIGSGEKDGVPQPIEEVESTIGAFYSDSNGALPQFGTLPTSLGGTGSESLTSNGVVLGNGTNAVKVKASAKGAFYSTGANQEPFFGTLPIGQGGTGKTTYGTNTIIAGNGNSLKEIDSTKGVFISSGNAQEPSFGTLGVSDGGTNATTAEQARINLGATKTSMQHPETGGVAKTILVGGANNSVNEVQVKNYWMQFDNTVIITQESEEPTD